MSNLTRSMSLVMEQFYSHLTFVKCSAVTGDGMDDLFQAIDGCVDEYYDDYLPELERMKEEKQKQKEEKEAQQKERLHKDFGKAKSAVGVDSVAREMEAKLNLNQSHNSKNDDNSKGIYL